MATLRLKTNQHNLIANLRHAFTQASMLGELLQNARRAQASVIHIAVTQDSLSIIDNGIGIANLQTLICIAESGWDEQIKASENAFGLGVLSTLYFAEVLMVHSRDKWFGARTSDIIAGQPFDDEAAPFYIEGTTIHLEGVKPVGHEQHLPTWVESELRRLCEAFPVPVWLNGVEVPRPLTDPELQWRETAMGKVLIDLSAAHTQWRTLLQGLPIGRVPTWMQHQIVLLPDNMLAKLPDRQHLLNEAEDRPRIQAAVDLAYREALIEKKASLDPRAFCEHYAASCLTSSNADLLNDVPFVPRAWFRDWQGEPAGIHRYWQHYGASGIVARDELEKIGVWRIETDEDDEHTAEVYLEARNAFLLHESGMDSGHWLKSLVRTITPEQVQVRTGATLYQDREPFLADYDVELELVDELFVSLNGHSDAAEYAVQALRRGYTLYLTPSAGAPTNLVSDYIFDDRYDENRENEDKELIATFIAVGCSSAPDQVVSALLPNSLWSMRQAKLAGAVVRLIFDEAGRLTAVTS
ncbi:ATP-binding protein [Phytopseudomonas dryadis]|uniref:ATP-binding protein n=1 Tax=Phytopseudomonas dryadis TaxID=2487520 RepID=A0A4V2KBR9_9GAMM|nr:ATP-binding protein [Pseudomonas dryadis]TBU88455.1 ATP-binding protein [Pseudomonas dryadis]